MLKREDLSEEERKKFEVLSAQLAGASLSYWLPTGFVRKMIMFILILGGIYGTIHWSLIATLLCFVLAATFSPRIIGEAVVAFGKTFKKK